jgi:serine/threonine protein kinase/tetratricopeptide (TPR) repeat protein
MMDRTRISHYELLEAIGRDGPTEIYRARDTRLERDVALKLLRSEETSRPAAVERFRREARIASLVTHPHICTVHDSGEEDGRAFLVCELLEGRALDEVMGGSPLQADRTIDIGIQLADALSAAHRRGIVHGSVKPSNVFITTDGHVKLLELGAAAAMPLEHDAAAGSATGTSVSRTTSIELARATVRVDRERFHPYLSPEQISGGADARSDIFSAGALLYEMATGVPAFAGSTPADLATAIAAHVPPRARTVNPAVPAPLEAIIARAIEKDPARRYQTAAELRDDLRRVRRAVDARRRLSPKWTASRRVRTAAAVAASVLVLAAAAGSARWWTRATDMPTVERSAILVSQIANGTADPDFDGTLRQALTIHLAQSPYLDLVSDDRIRGALQLMGRDPDSRMTHEVAEETCQRLGLQAMIEGSVSAIGASTIVALVATDCGTGATIAREQVEVDRKEEVLRAMGRLTASMRKSLGESVASLTRHNVPIEEATTPSMAALKSYTEAVARRAAGAETDAVKLLERATSVDPQFALAYTTLSSIYGGFGETGRSEEYARLAYEHRSRVSERERLFITYQYDDRVTGDQLKARETLEVWKATYPRDYRPANALAVMLNRLGDYAGAADEAAEAMARNPAHAFPRSNLAFAHRGAGKFTEARAVIEEALARQLETLPMRRLLYQLAVLQGDGAAAQRQVEWAASRPRGFDMTGARAQVAAFHGRMAEARTLYAEAIEDATARGFPQVASGYAAQAAVTEALYGYKKEAIARARQVLKVATAFEPQLRAAAALALAGAPDQAESVLRRLHEIRPADTLLHGVYFPIAESAVQLARGRPDVALDALRPSSRYERGTVAALVPVFLRAQARLSAGAAAEAAGEFRTVFEARGADPFSPVIPVSQLGLARALAAAGASADSRHAYEELMRTWASADQDLPVLRQAREERSRLTTMP